MTRRRLWAVEECIEEECSAEPLARSLCSMHYQRRRLRGEEMPPKVRKPLAGVVCKVTSCTVRAVAHEMCGSHVARFRRYGLTASDLAEFDKIKHCEACGGSAQHIDHDHRTGDVRGVLCRACNTSLGVLGDDRGRLQALIHYLDRYLAARP